jgi:hypothetical protein
MIFVNGVLIGGASELQQLVENGEFSAMLARCASSDVLAYSPGRRRGARAQRVEQAAQVVVVEFVHPARSRLPSSPEGKPSRANQPGSAVIPAQIGLQASLVFPIGHSRVSSSASFLNSCDDSGFDGFSVADLHIVEFGATIFCLARYFSQQENPDTACHPLLPEFAMPIALLALTLSAFAIGTTEFVIVGLLPTIAADLGVNLPSAGLLVSLYALGVAVGAPVLTALTGKILRKTLLLSLMVLFTWVICWPGSRPAMKPSLSPAS